MSHISSSSVRSLFGSHNWLRTNCSHRKHSHAARFCASPFLREHRCFLHLIPCCGALGFATFGAVFFFRVVRIPFSFRKPKPIFFFARRGLKEIRNFQHQISYIRGSLNPLSSWHLACTVCFCRGVDWTPFELQRFRTDHLNLDHSAANFSLLRLEADRCGRPGGRRSRLVLFSCLELLALENWSCGKSHNVP